MAPKVFNVSTLELELKILKTEVTRLSKFGDAPTDTSTAAAPGSTRAFALGAAMSKLASTEAAIERQRTGERQCLRVGVQIGPWGETIKPCLYRLALRLSKGRYSFMRRN